MTADTFSLSGKSALITGSGKENGIGAAIARALAKNGASVAIHHLSEQSKPKAEKVATDISNEFGVKVTVVQGSVGHPDSARKVVKDALIGLGTDHIDILVNNAGRPNNEDLLHITQEGLEETFQTNVFGAVYMIQAAVTEGKMPRSGRIINIGSIISKFSGRMSAAYAASKAAQDSFTAAWADELGRDHGITVNTIAPGPVLTDMAKSALEGPDGTLSPIGKALVSQTRAEDRLGRAEDISDAVVLLVQEKSRWITAQWISVSGGFNGAL